MSIDEIINKDLEQSEKEGLSFTVKENQYSFRHYELGNCFGLCACREPEYDGLTIFNIHNGPDTLYVYYPNSNDSYDAFYLREHIRLEIKMRNWIEENCDDKTKKLKK